jgi:hypothetical protein
VTAGDQLLQIVVGRVHRHAAHGDVLAQVLAAFGQRDAQRLRSDLRIFEKQLVEIAHPVEQQAVRIGGFNFHELCHHRCDAMLGRLDFRKGLVRHGAKLANPFMGFTIAMPFDGLEPVIFRG